MEKKKDIEYFVEGYAKCIEELKDRLQNSIQKSKNLKENAINVINDIINFIYYKLAEINETKQILQGDNDQKKLTLIKGGKKQ